MFPVRSGYEKQPMPPSSFAAPPTRRLPQQINSPSILSQFKTTDGQLDLEKISITAKQINDIYQQVSPMVRPMITKFFNK